MCLLKWKEFSFIIGGLKIIYVYESEEHLRSIRVGDSGRDFRRFELVYFFFVSVSFICEFVFHGKAVGFNYFPP